MEIDIISSFVVNEENCQSSSYIELAMTWVFICDKLRMLWALWA